MSPFAKDSFVWAGEMPAVDSNQLPLYEVTHVGRTLAVNPGAIMGITFKADGSRTEVAPTFAIYDTATGEAQGFRITDRLGIV